MTMREVAELAGVSSAAVSRYLNGGYVAEDKRERIRAAIERTGYSRSAQARALRTGRSQIVGVMVSNINSESLSRIVSGIGATLREAGYQMLLSVTGGDADRELASLDMFQHYPVEGILFAAAAVTPRHRAALGSLRVPFVVIGQHVEGVRCVYHDDYGAARELARRIAPGAGGPVSYIGFTNEDEAVGLARFEGFRRGLEDLGLAFDERLYRQADLSVEAGHRCARSLLGEDPAPALIACATDTIAAGAIRALQERGVSSAPSHVCGFGDNGLLRAVTGGIATVHFGYKTSGMRAAEMLLARIDGKDDGGARQVRLGYRLVGC